MNRPVKKPNIYRLFPCALLLGGLTMGLCACNEKSDDSDDDKDKIVYLPNVAVTAFNLKADKGIMNKLDSVFFSIDLEHGVIFNADSLPMGSNVNKLVANISYSSSIKTARIIMSGGTTRTDTIDYIKHPGDSIDFTGNVKLVIATENNEMEKSYSIKVNVHRQQPDSLVWNETALASLPSRLPNPRNQKTVDINGKAVTLIEESDGSHTLATSDDLYKNLWTKSGIALSFTPEIRSLAASSSSLYILDSNGNLYTSTDGQSWTDSGEDWNKIIGGYMDTAIGLKTTSQGLVYAQYPHKDLSEKAVDRSFPIEGHSNFMVHSNKWTSSPVGFFCGGTLPDGSFSNSVWAFDGAEWTKLTQGGFPALNDASLIPYYAFRQTSSNEMLPSELEVWMILGGELSDGTFNRTLYISYDNGVNWKKGDDLLQLPDIIPAMTRCDNIVIATTLDTNLSDAWKVMQRNKVKWSVDGDVLSWECPYIYLIGGFGVDNKLCNTIWRGALNRLQSAPVI